MTPDVPNADLPSNETAPGARHLMSVIVEDYFQVGAFRKHIDPQQWDRFESRLIRNTEAALDLLARYNVKATFFILGWNAEQCPELVRRIVEEGHEVASGGYHHDNLREMARDEFCERIQQVREVIESAAGQPVLGYRMSEGWLKQDDLWLLDHLAEQGYAYDSSLLPRGREFRSEPSRRFAHQHESSAGKIWELPPSSLRLPFFNVPIAGGNYFRQIPHTLMRHLTARLDRTQSSPMMLYFHVWELDTEQPEVSAAGRLTHLRHYRNLGKMNWVLPEYFKKYHFGSVAQYLSANDHEWWQSRLEERLRVSECGTPREANSSPISTPCSALDTTVSSESATPVTIVVPCYNEEQTVPYLAKTLDSLRTHLAADYRVQFILVDDGSTDRTWELLTQCWADTDSVTLLKHEQNAGVAQAILTGIDASKTNIVCSMDCDCSYDPHKLREMIPLLTDDVDLVTASPYHADGEVKNVPGWRLVLSRGASALYRLVLGEPLATFTSCFRVYRRESVVNLPVENGNFLGIAELLGRLLINGGTVVEYPTTLSVRLFGHSKMKTMRTIGGHLKLLSRLLRMRWRSKRKPSPDVTENSPAMTAVDTKSVANTNSSVARTPTA